MTTPPPGQLVPQAHTTPETDNPVTGSPTRTTGVPDALLAAPSGAGALMIELDERSWQDALGRARDWFDTVLTTQTSFRELAEDTQGRVKEPHLKEYLGQVADAARRHEQAVQELYRIIGHEPPAARKALGVVAAKGREVLGSVLGVVGDAAGGWPRLHMLFLSSLDSISAFAAAQQFGLALGIREINEVCFPVVNEKFLYHRLLQEITLETVPQAMLYGREI